MGQNSQETEEPLTIDRVKQYLRLRQTFAKFHYEPCTDNERWAYVELSGAMNNIRGRQTGEKFFAQLKSIFGRGLYETDKKKLEELQKKVASAKNKFYHGSTLHDVIVGNYLAVETENASLEKITSQVLDEKLRGMPASEKERIYNQYPEAYFPEKKEVSAQARFERLYRKSF